MEGAQRKLKKPNGERSRAPTSIISISVRDFFQMTQLKTKWRNKDGRCSSDKTQRSGIPGEERKDIRGEQQQSIEDEKGTAATDEAQRRNNKLAEKKKKKKEGQGQAILVQLVRSLHCSRNVS